MTCVFDYHALERIPKQHQFSKDVGLPFDVRVKLSSAASRAQEAAASCAG